eukprot:TRINITY_DN20344_c0_g1_i1.p1 TRINITY_DN20344_c0_g1~~TRINITY_DN20344_c0_g1_i1.p1  ORF type:complete len:120 (+),score=32.92 TRINITY_DN20344_c0_g1_i1:35-361(+)
MLAGWDETPTEQKCIVKNDVPIIKLNRSQRKRIKAVEKLGMELLPNISSVKIVKEDVLLTITDPEVFQNSSHTSFLVFGVANIEEPGSEEQEQSPEDSDVHTEAPHPQ